MRDRSFRRGASDDSSPPLGLNCGLIPVTFFIRNLERIGDLDAGDPDDLTVPNQQRNAVALFDGDLAIDEEVLQFLRVTAEAEGAEAVSASSIPNRKVRFRAGGKLKRLPAISADAKRRADGGNEDFAAGVDLEFVIRDPWRNLAQEQLIIAPNQLEQLRDVRALDRIEVAREMGVA